MNPATAILEEEKNLRLPSVDLFCPSHPALGYGCGEILAAYCGLQSAPESLPHQWQADWIPREADDGYRGILEAIPHLDRPILVSNPRTVEFLEGLGVNHARAIGLPIAYFEREPNDLPRRPGSLLVVPGARDPIAEFAEQVTRVKDQFSTVVACIDGSVSHGRDWEDEFLRRGFRVVRAPAANDRNGFRRMLALFQSFEFMVTDGLGGHVAYASWLGCRVSVLSAEAGMSTGETAKSQRFRKVDSEWCPRLHTASELPLSEDYRHLFCEPQSAVVNPGWAAEEIGVGCRLSPQALCDALGWSTKSRVKLLARSITHKAVEISKSVVPPIAMHLTRSMVSAGFRAKERERRRLEALPRHQATSTRLLGKSLQLVDAASFLYTTRSIFGDEIYRFIPTDENPYIVDCGANIGLSVIWFRDRYPAARIVAFEPDPEIFQVLSENVRTFDRDGDTTLINKAVWTEECELKFISEGADAGAVVGDMAVESGTIVSATRLRSYLSKERVAMLKIDIEGAETPVLKDCEDLLCNVDNLFVEYHSYVNDIQTIDELLSVLRRAGFRVHIHPENFSRKPFVRRYVGNGMDHQLNIFAFR